MLSLLLLAVGLAFGGNKLTTAVVAQTTAVDSAGDTLLPEDYYVDGPHVFWQNDTTAIVLYLCRNEVNADTFYVADTLSFNGACADSGVTYQIAVSPPEIEPDTFTNASRILVISDIHGEYDHFVSFLKNAGIIDDALQWAWGDGNLVVLGDVFDRGPKHTECLWLIYDLEKQARLAGGRVHFVLGNHELMILRGDNRYVNERYLDGIVVKTRIDHEDLYGPDTELGRWLRTKPTVIKINSILFVHGGLSPHLLERGWNLSEINDLVRSSLDLRSSQLAFDETARLLFGSVGPLWYRGYHYAMEDRYEQACSTEVDEILARYATTTIVVGHTESEAIHTAYRGQIMAIDIPVEEIGSFEAVLWENGVFRRVCGAGKLWPIE